MSGDYLKQKVDPDRKIKLLEERQDKALSDLRKRESTPIIKDSSLTTKDVWKVKGGTDKIDTKSILPTISGSSFTDKIADFRAAKKFAKEAGKKVAGILPLAGTAYGMLSGDPAMAAEEAVGDIPVAGQIYDSLKSEDAGNREEEKIMLAERKALDNYKKSEAGMAAQARREALANLK